MSIDNRIDITCINGSLECWNVTSNNRKSRCGQTIAK